MRQILAILLVLVTLFALGENNVATNYAAAALKPYIVSGELPGAISVFISGDKGEVAAVGFADVDKARLITLNDSFMQCSQTKGFCGVTMAKLVEEGKVSLDDPVAKYLPEFKTLWIYDGDSNGVRRLKKATTPLTIKMCLNHTGGFPFEICAKQPNIKGGGWSGGAPIRQVAAIAAASPLLFEPGTRAQYSNTGIDVAAAVIEVVTKEKWEVYLKKTVLDPLAMHDTTFWPTEKQLKTKIELYDCVKGGKARWRLQDDWQQRPYNDSHVFASAGAGLWTTTRDQLKFYKMLMNLGVGENGVRILKEETVRSLLATTTRDRRFGEYSLGLVIEQGGWFGHGGAHGTNCMVNPDKKQLKLWVVQLKGGPRPWDNAIKAAANQFFKASLSTSATDAYTGRTE